MITEHPVDHLSISSLFADEIANADSKLLFPPIECAARNATDVRRGESKPSLLARMPWH